MPTPTYNPDPAKIKKAADLKQKAKDEIDQLQQGVKNGTITPNELLSGLEDVKTRLVNNIPTHG